MQKIIIKIARGLIAVISGYAVIVAGTILAFEVWLGGIGYYKSPVSVLLIASVAAFISGFAGGFAAAWIGGKPYLVFAAGVAIFLIADSIFVISSGKSPDPVWYDLFGAMTLMAAAIIGGYVKQLLSARPLPIGETLS